ncbi:MAG: ABC transporter permease [Actinomycetota bacterium]|nr:ABC transporter permease [Actinomycetota bacterium]
MSKIDDLDEGLSGEGGDNNGIIGSNSGGEAHASGSQLKLIVQTFLENKLAIVGIALVIIAVLFCFVGPLFYHTNQVTTSYNITQAPGHGHPLGTDQNGYDVLGRLMVGGQSSLEIGFSVAIIATIIGVLYGAIAGFIGGVVDTIMMRVVDTLLSIPTLLLLIFLAAVFRPTLTLLIIVISAVSWLSPARLVRGEALTLRVRDYVKAVRVMGGGSRRIILRHIVPNAIGTIVVNATFQIADAILVMATLSYLGLGLPPPAANWGSMLSDGVNYVYDGYWWLIYPAGIAIILTVVAFNLIGDAIRDSLEVRLQKR